MHGMMTKVVKGHINNFSSTFWSTGGMFGSSCNVWILRFFCIAGEARPETALVAKEKGTFESLGIWWKMSYEPKIYEWSMFKISNLLHFYWSLTIHAIKIAATKTRIRNQSCLFGAELEIQHDGRTFWVDWRPKTQHKLESCHFFSNTFGSCTFPAFMSSFFLCLIWANSPQLLYQEGFWFWLKVVYSYGLHCQLGNMILCIQKICNKYPLKN